MAEAMGVAACSRWRSGSSEIGGDGTDYAIYAQGTTGIVISDNTISGPGTDAIHLKDSVDNTVSGNTLSRFVPSGTAGILLETGTTQARVTCASPRDTVQDQGPATQ